MKSIPFLVFIWITLIHTCSHGVHARDRVNLNLQTDFINSESNLNKKPTIPPAVPNQPNAFNKPPGPIVAPTPATNVRDYVNKNINQNLPTPTSAPPKNVQQPNPTPNVNNQGNLPTPTGPKNVLQPNPTPVVPPKNVPVVPAPVNPPRENFPALPSSQTTAKPALTNQFNYASVVSGNKQVIPVPVTNKPTGGYPFNQNQGTSTVAAELISDNELKEISELLYRKENSPVKHMTINYQATTTSQSKNDVAPKPLIELTPSIWEIPTIAAMKTLLDNYEQDAAVNEYVTPQEKNEENAFIDLIMATPVMRQLMTSLKDKRLVSPDPKLQRDIIKQIWFNLYSRGQGKIGSSGFEHIFLSEIKNNEISGLHNWLYFYLEEEAKRANYLGYMRKLTFGNKGGIIKFHFNLKGIDKPVDAMFVGTSPELEMALYSLCFITRADKSCPLWLDGQKFNIRTHTFRYRSKNLIGSAFPEI